MRSLLEARKTSHDNQDCTCKNKDCGATINRFTLKATNRSITAQRNSIIFCDKCQREGCSTNSSAKEKALDQPYKCVRCHAEGVRHFFESHNFHRNWKRDSLQCKECFRGTRGGEQCKQPNCRKFVEEKDLTRSEKKSRSRGFVCKCCRENGYSVKDLRGYICSVCKTTSGRRKFSDAGTNFTYWSKQGKLKCIDCAAMNGKWIPFI